jgi:solute carrier family 45, member 1/2/4
LEGYLSDRSRAPWGRRRPVIVIGAVSTTFSILLLGCVEETVCWLVDLWNLEIQQDHLSKVVIALAVFWIYVLNISIQPFKVGLGSLAIENCPAHQQAQASAWASRMTGFGNIIGYTVRQE